MHRAPTLLVLAALVALAAPASAAAGDPKLRAEVAAFQKSLKAAWDAGDAAKVLGHFEHGELLSPHGREYRMLGRLGFWEKPIGTVTESRGTIRAEFVLDPESDSPAQKVTLTLVRAGGRLLVKSEAAPQELERLRQARQAEAGAAREARAVAATIEALPKVASWPLRDRFLAMVTAAKGPMPKDVALYPLAEVYRGDRAALFLTAAERGELSRDVMVMGFRKKGAEWELFEDQLDFRGWEPVEEHVFKGPGETRIVRRAGLPLETLPAYLRYVRRELREDLRAAVAARDWARAEALVEHGLAGVALKQVEQAFRDLGRDEPRPVEAVRIAAREAQGDRAIVTFEVVEGGRAEREPWVAIKEGGGWVLLERYVSGADRTIAAMRTVVSLLEVHSAQHGLYPARLDELLKLDPKVALVDTWGTPLRYAPGKDRKSYTLASAGADRAFQPETWSKAGRFADLAEDAVWTLESGFVREWEVTP